jgi:hypothetical protein
MFGMGGQEMKEITATTQLGYYKEFIVDTKDVVKPNDIVVSTQFSEDIDFFLELGNVLWVIA